MNNINDKTSIEKWIDATRKLQNKYNHYLLNLNYPIDNISDEIMTNSLITKVLNKMLNFIESQPDKVFVYDYKDDLPSLIGYKLIVLCRSQSDVNFELRLLGKARRTKKQLQKRQKFITEKKIKKNLDNYVIFSSFNPIYEVLEVGKIFKDFGLKRFDVIGSFMPQDFLVAKKFYGIKGIKDDWFSEDIGMMSFLNTSFYDLNKNNIWSDSLKTIGLDKVDVVWIDNDIEKTIKSLQEVQDSNTIVFYFYKNEECEGVKVLKDYNYSYLVKKKTNIPSYRYQNLNNYKAIKFCKILGIKLNLIGFSTEDYLKFIGR